MRSRCDGSMLACTLKTNPAKGASRGRGTSSSPTRGVGDGDEVDDRVEQHADAEVGQCGAEEDRCRLRRQEGLGVQLRDDDVEQVELLLGRGPGPTLLVGRSLGGHVLLGRHGGAVAGAGEAGEATVSAPVGHAPEVAGEADRPGHRRGGQPDLLLDLVDQLDGVPARPVPLVDEAQQGQAPVPADLEELERLRLDALGRVQHHDRGVGRGQDPVGVLGEVPVPRGVEQVQDVVPVRELQHRRGDGDAPLLLQLHPVRRGRPLVAPPLHRSGGAAQGAAVEQELLGQGRLPGVGMADDGEGPAAPGFLDDVTHG